MLNFPLNFLDLEAKIREARLRLLQMHYEAKVGHIGGNLSCLDALMVIYHGLMNEPDSFVLSKGHSAGALYVTLWSLGLLKDDELKTFHGNPTKLAGHPSPYFGEAIPFATGSLGHGLSLASGLALGRRLQGQSGQVYCLTSDGEWQEGSTWEALIFVCHQRLSNLTVVIDANGLQGFGSTDKVASLSDLPKKLSVFDIDLTEADGHDLSSVCTAVGRKSEKPKIVVLNTTKGKGVSFMENKMEWHYLPLTQPLYEQAKNEVSQK